MIEISTQYLKLRNIPGGLRIVQFSDLHIFEKNISSLELCVEKINSLKADIVIFTGDAICRGCRYLKELLFYLRKAEAALGKYYCLGNHDYSDGYNSQMVRETMKKADFSLLCNSSEELSFRNKHFFIAGFDDVEKGYLAMDENMKENINSGCIVAVHNPKSFSSLLKYSPSLTLSGHTHGGQIKLPFSDYLYRSYLKSPYISGLYRDREAYLYVNRGIGHAVFDFSFFDKKIAFQSPRINSSSEITLIRTL